VVNGSVVQVPLAWRETMVLAVSNLERDLVAMRHRRKSCRHGRASSGLNCRGGFRYRWCGVCDRDSRLQSRLLRERRRKAPFLCFAVGICSARQSGSRFLYRCHDFLDPLTGGRRCCQGTAHMVVFASQRVGTLVDPDMVSRRPYYFHPKRARSPFTATTCRSIRGFGTLALFS